MPASQTILLPTRDGASDADLVGRARDGDRFSRELLYRRHAAYLLGMATRLLASRAEAEEVVQDTFVRGFTQMGALREPAAVRAWLAQIAVSQVGRRLRRARLARFLGLDRAADDAALAALAAPGAAPDQRAELAMVDRALGRLRAELRVAWMLRHVEGLELTEVATACGCSLATVKRRIASAEGFLEKHHVGKGELPMIPAGGLRGPVKESLRDPVDEAALRRIWVEIEARLPRRRAAPRRLAVWTGVTLAGAVVLGAAVAAAVLWPLRGGPGPLRLADGRPPAALDAVAGDEALSLADGSRIALARGGRLDPLENDGTRFAAILRRGSAVFDVRPGGPRRWMIECGLATVEVVGTRFRIQRGAHRLLISVERGAVVVRGERVPDRVRRLGAGESIEVLDAPPPTLVPVPAAVAPAAAASPVPPPASPTRPRRGVADAPASWRDLARRGQHREAFSALGADGVRRESARLGVDDLLALADVARLSGHPAEAVGPLERVLSEFPGDAQAPLAAFALGRLELDALERPGRAARAFARALELGIPAGLKEDAMARLVEAEGRAGDREAAQAAARAYARDYPGGRHAAAIQGWMIGARKP